MLSLISALALAVPFEMSHQGRLLDATSGAPLVGNHDVTFTLYDGPTTTSSLWTETHDLPFDEGHYTAWLGTSTSLDDTLFDGTTRYLGVSVDGGAELERIAVISVPYAVRSNTATNLSGGVVDASEIRVGGSVVIDGTGSFSGTVEGDTLGGLSCGSGQLALFDGASWTCQDAASAVDWATLGGIPLGFADDVDDDVLGGMSCVAGEVPQWNGSWSCYDPGVAIAQAAIDGWDATSATVAGSGLSTSNYNHAAWEAAAATVTAGSGSWDAAAATVTAGASSWDTAATTVTASGLTASNYNNAAWDAAVQQGDFADFAAVAAIDAQDVRTWDGQYGPNLVNDTAWTGGPTLTNTVLPRGYEGPAHTSTGTGASGDCYEWAYSNIFPVDSGQSYEFSLWIDSDEAGLNNYFGFHVYDAAGARITTEGMNNPYFKTNEGDDGLGWTKWTGYLLASTTPSNGSGVPDTDAPTNGVDWVMPASAAYARVRYGSCYSAAAGGVTYFAEPGARGLAPNGPTLPQEVWRATSGSQSWSGSTWQDHHAGLSGQMTVGTTPFAWAVSLDGHYTDTAGKHMRFRVAATHQVTGQTHYLPDANGHSHYMYTDNNRLEEATILGVDTLPAGTYDVQMQLRIQSGAGPYTWSSSYGFPTMVVY